VAVVTRGAAGEAVFDPVFSQLPLPAFLFDGELRVAAVNAEFERRLGRVGSELRGRSAAVLVRRDELARVIRLLGRMRLPGVADDESDWLLTGGDGEAVRARVRLRPVDLDGMRHVLGVVLGSDPVPDGVRGRFDREELFRAMFETAPMPMSIQDRQFRFVDVNAAYCALLGYAREKVIGRDALALMPPQVHEEVRARRAQVPFHEEPTGVVAEQQLVRSDGCVISTRGHYRVVKGIDGNDYVLVALTDLTDEHEMRHRFERQARSLEQFFEFAPVGLVLRDAQRRVLRVNRAFTAVSGFTLHDLLGDHDPLQPLDDSPEGVAAKLAWQESERAPGAIGRARVPLVARDGRQLLTYQASTAIESPDGERLRLTAVSDVTQEHALEEELRRLVLQQGALLRTMASGVMLVVRDRVTRCNASLELLLGLPTERIVGRQVAHVLRSDRSWEALRADAGEALGAGSTYGCEVELQRPSQQPVVCALQLRLVDPSRFELGLIVTLNDITELKRQQASLLQANAELSALIENTAVAIAYLDRERVVRCNRMMETLLGCGPGGLAGRRLDEFVLPEDRVGLGLLEAVAEPSRGARTLGVRLLGAGGAPIACLVHLGPVDPVRWPTASILVAIDMSGQQAALSALAESQERFGRFAEAIDEAVFVIDADRRRALYANTHFEKVLGTPAEEFLGSPDSAWRHVAPEDRPALDALMAQAMGPGQHECDVKVLRPDGSRRVVRLRLFQARLGSSELYALAEDVTEIRDLAQRRIDEAIQQRDTLVREVHHRIKNNLQGVAGLLQQSAVRRPEIAPQLDEIVGQIQAIAQVHGLQVRDRGDLSLARIARAVFDNLSRGFGRAIQYDAAAFEALQAWSVPEQEAVPVALVVNELGTNAIKHRSPEGGVRASIALRDRSLVLSIANDGRLPDGFSLERLPTSPSGLGLIKALLPRRGTRLTLQPQGDAVLAELHLGAPVIRLASPG
jgi:PAS domain S-box-containing protein